MSADFEGNDKDAVVTQQVLDVIDSYGFKKEGAYNLRLNGLAVCHGDSRHIKIVPKEDRQGIDIYISGEAKDEQYANNASTAITVAPAGTVTSP